MDGESNGGSKPIELVVGGATDGLQFGWTWMEAKNEITGTRQSLAGRAPNPETEGTVGTAAAELVR